MENIKFEVKDGKLIITINLEHNGGVSASGKSEIVASTRGNVQVPGTDIMIGVNAYKPLRRR